MKSIDFERAKLLMDIVVSAGQHGPMYQKLASEAGKELKAMIDDKERDERRPIVTPPGGPENSAWQNPDGSLERIPPIPPDNTVAGQRSEKTGEDLNARARRMADQADLPGDEEARRRNESLAEATERRESNETEAARRAKGDRSPEREAYNREVQNLNTPPDDPRRKI